MIVCFIACFLAQLYSSCCSAPRCDSSSEPVQEGNNGETAAFSWLGILRVNLYKGQTLKVALTGIVMVREGYAIANADDVAKIPKTYLIMKSKAMFIYQPERPWYCTVKDYMMHPEYQYTTTTTLALLELQSESMYFPVRPICWPPYTHAVTTHLYAMGFTDENQLLEKSVYKLQNVDLNICKEFYERAGLTEGMMAPTSFRCGFAANNTRNCVWDNGMVLASNSTGHWTLLGFGIKGPGCAAPARFLDMLTYFRWIDTSTDEYDIDDQYRRSALGVGFKKNETVLVHDVPVHDLFAMSEVETRQAWPSNDSDPFDTEQHQSRYYSIEKIDRDHVVIWAENVEVPYTHGNCSENYLQLVYSETFKIKSEGSFGKAVYKVSVMDLNELEFTCIAIRVKPWKMHATATIHPGVSIDVEEAMSDVEKLPQGLLKHYIPRPTAAGAGGAEPGEWRPGHHLQVEYIHDRYYVIKQPNVNIILKFDYKDQATYKVTIFSSRSVATTTKQPDPNAEPIKKGQKKSILTTSTKKQDERSYTVFNETFNSYLEKTLGVDVKEVDRYMKEMASSASASVKRMGDVGVSLANGLVILILLSFSTR